MNNYPLEPVDTRINCDSNSHGPSQDEKNYDLNDIIFNLTPLYDDIDPKIY